MSAYTYIRGSEKKTSTFAERKRKKSLLLQSKKERKKTFVSVERRKLKQTLPCVEGRTEMTFEHALINI
jgi:hypothetical protein